MLRPGGHARLAAQKLLAEAEASTPSAIGASSTSSHGQLRQPAHHDEFPGGRSIAGSPAPLVDCGARVLAKSTLRWPPLAPRRAPRPQALERLLVHSARRRALRRCWTLAWLSAAWTSTEDAADLADQVSGLRLHGAGAGARPVSRPRTDIYALESWPDSSPDGDVPGRDAMDVMVAT